MGNSCDRLTGRAVNELHYLTHKYANGIGRPSLAGRVGRERNGKEL